MGGAQFMGGGLGGAGGWGAGGFENMEQRQSQAIKIAFQIGPGEKQKAVKSSKGGEK